MNNTTTYYESEKYPRPDHVIVDDVHSRQSYETDVMPIRNCWVPQYLHKRGRILFLLGATKAHNTQRRQQRSKL
jgi:hypothetical protein